MRKAERERIAGGWTLMSMVQDIIFGRPTTCLCAGKCGKRRLYRERGDLAQAMGYVCPDCVGGREKYNERAYLAMQAMAVRNNEN